MTTENKFDCVVLGAGPGGYVAAIRLSQLGKSVAIIEEKYWGGVCLNVGCIPSKTLLNSASLAHSLRERASEYGIDSINPDYSAAYERSRDVAEGRVKGIHYLMRKNKIQEFQGRGVFIDDHTLKVDGADGESSEINFEFAVIATGSSVKPFPNVPFSRLITSYEEQILESEAPESIAIIGAGPIGVEFSFILANYGTTVDLIEYQGDILPNEDPEVAREVHKSLTALGVNVHVGTEVRGLRENGNRVEVDFQSSEDQSGSLSVSKAMVSIGFSPNTEGFGAEGLGLESQEGAIWVDDQMRTSKNHIFAIGDVTGKMQLAHVAEAQAIIAAETIAGLSPNLISDYRFMPRAVFSEPQVASFGLRQDEAESEGISLKISKFPLMANGKANAVGKPAGFIKLLMNESTKQLVGAHLVGKDVSELLPELTLAYSGGLDIEDLAQNVHIHPTLSESLQEAIHGLSGEMINF